MLKVYGFSKVNAFARGNTRDLRVLWALEEMQMPFELVGMDHPAHDLNTDAYRRLSPFEQLPAKLPLVALLIMGFVTKPGEATTYAKNTPGRAGNFYTNSRGPECQPSQFDFSWHSPATDQPSDEMTYNKE